MSDKKREKKDAFSGKESVSERTVDTNIVIKIRKAIHAASTVGNW